MATSGTTSYQQNARQIITTALQIIRVVPAGDVPTADDAADAENMLNLMLKSWGTHSHLWIMTYGTTALVEGQAEYTIDGARRMKDVFRRATYGTNITDTPMFELSRLEYDQMPNKFNQGVPVNWYFNPQRSTRSIYVWPCPDAGTAANSVLRYTYFRVIEDVDSLNNDIDFPQEWLETLTWGLADRLMEMHNVNYPTVTARAQALWQTLQAQDQEPVAVYVQPQMSY